ncbi:MAG TPA: endonuclease MutS2 [Chloroflexota bacterium]|nr:endonuclease MutS2 [Chloroflexota bacterium]
MTISDRTLHTLEFDKIVERLAGYAGFSAGRELLLALRPATEMDIAQRLVHQVTEARALLDSRPGVTIGGSRDVRAAAKRAALGGVLRGEELLSIAGTLEAVRELKSAIGRAEVDIPWIRSVAASLDAFPDVAARINRSLDSEGQVLDSASSKLRSLRNEIKTAHGRILDKLNSMVTSPDYRSALQEPIVTMRNGRYVVPVRSDGRSKVPGIVHDQSATGQTSFVEPLAVTELNNRWAELQMAEQREIERILEELSRHVGGVGDGIVGNVDALAELDATFAKAKYAQAIQAVPPLLNRDGRISLLKARHPLLTGDVVPISVTLGRDFSILVITGPNTGGKTVTLKTVGLLTLMGQAGLHLPCEAGSEAALFDSIWADIGDEQSIEQSLSTFSSHMRNIVDILQATDDRSLVLLDELGAGTDPAEGSGLARAIIRELLDRKCRAVITTHYSELKAFAYDQPGVENASVEFDVATLSPTYRLIIGVPGRSQAMAIAKRLGLRADIIERARSYLSRGGVRVEKLLSQIQHERQAIGKLYKRAQEVNEDLAKIRDRLQQETEVTRRERTEVLKEARAEAAESLRAFRARLEELEAEAGRGGQMRGQSPSIRAVRERAEAARRDILPTVEQIQETAPRRPEVQGRIEVGDEVRIKSLEQVGSVTSTADDSLEIQVGNFKMRRPRADVELLAKSSMGQQGVVRLTGAVPAPSLEIDIRGRRPSEVEPELERYINDGYMSGLDTLRVIHGHGTGALRRAIREQLETHPLVSGLGPASKDQGGDGVTVVTLAR